MSTLPVAGPLSLHCPQAYLISAGMDGLVKAWQVLEQALPGMVVRPDAEYVFDKENPDEGGQQTQQGGGPGRRRVSRGVE
jgi:hypothetical protein